MDEPSRPPAPRDEEDPLPDKKAGALDERCVVCTSCFLVVYVRDLAHHFSWKLLILLFFCQHLIKGFLASLVQQATPFVFEQYGLSAVEMQIYQGIIILPLSMKPVLGLLSDLFPINGYKKAPYMLATAVLGTFAHVVIGEFAGSGLSIAMVVTCIFVAYLQAATVDILSEAAYAERMQDNPTYGPALVTYVFGGLVFTGIVGTVAAGCVITNFGAPFAFLLCAPIAAAMIVPLLRGYTEERPVTRSQLAQARLRFWEQKEAVVIALLMFVGSLLITFMPIFSSKPIVIAAVSSSVALVILAAFSVFMSPVIAKVNAYFLLQAALVWNIDGATFYFYTDTPEQFPDGPHFTTFYFTTVLTLTANITSMIGIVCYQRYGKNFTYRRLMVGINVFYTLLGLFDVMLLTGLNKKVGISDAVMAFGSKMGSGCCTVWLLMGSLVIMSYLCPKGMEATMFAMLASCTNIGATVSMHLGAAILAQLNCEPSGDLAESKQFENIWMAGLLKAVMPLVIAVCLSWLLPEKAQNVNLLGATDDATTGSLWKSWTKRAD